VHHERVEVRFRRGDAWQLARARSMTREGISIATGTPPAAAMSSSSRSWPAAWSW